MRLYRKSEEESSVTKAGYGARKSSRVLHTRRSRKELLPPCQSHTITCSCHCLPPYLLRTPTGGAASVPHNDRPAFN